MTEVAEIFIKIIHKCNDLLKANLLTEQENEQVRKIVEKIDKRTQAFNNIVTSKNNLTKDDLYQLHIYLKSIINNLEYLHSLFPKISKRYFAIIEEAKEA